MAYHREWIQGGPQGGTELILEHDAVYLRHAVDGQRVLDENARLRQHAQRGTPMMGARLAARVPVELYYMWRREWEKNWSHIFTWNTFKKSRLNAREWERLRTSEMKL